MSVEDAFRDVQRKDFLPDDMKDQAGWDMPIRIGFGQTNSQPTTVRMMLEWLEPQLGDKVLDIGSGSGWTTALLSYIVGKKGRVYAVEKVPELLEFGRTNCQQSGVTNAKFYAPQKQFGLPKFAPYDRILVSASADSLPKELIEQLKIGGRLVIPVRSSVLIINKTSGQDYEITEHPGFAFVPLIK